jgi:hypothetical protein
VLFILAVTYAEYHIKGLYSECRYAECRYSDCRGARNRGEMFEKETNLTKVNFSLSLPSKLAFH